MVRPTDQEVTVVDKIICSPWSPGGGSTQAVRGPTGHTRASLQAEKAGNMGREPVVPVETGRLGIAYLE